MKELNKRVKELEKLFKATGEIHSKLELQECLKAVIDKVITLLEVEIGSLMMVDEGQQHLTVEVAHGLPKDVIKKYKIKVGEGIAGWIAEKGKPLLIKDIRKDKRFPRRGGRYTTESLLSVPLKLGGKIIGVINVNNKRSKSAFREDDLELLTALASQAAQAIHNATQFKETRETSEVKLQFLANVTHELRAPLTCIKEALSLVSEKKASAQEKFLTIARQNTDRLVHLVNDVLDFSKMRSGKLHMRRQLVNVVELAKNVTESISLKADNKKIKIKVDYDSTFPSVWADSDKITEVLINLLDNAIKFTPEGGKIRVEAKSKPKEIEVIVGDTGPGIPREDQERIFKKFEQLEGDRAKGTGLGLPIAKEIVEMHKGRMWLESKAGKETRFHFTLPKDIRKTERQQAARRQKG